MTFDRPGTFDVSVCAAPTLPRLEPAVEVAAYRTVAEAMSNAAHHAQARRCEVQVRGDGDLVVIDVVDDGLRLQAGSTSTGLGLRSMRARVESVGGRLRIDGVEPHGTRVSASFPVHRERDAP